MVPPRLLFPLFFFFFGFFGFFCFVLVLVLIHKAGLVQDRPSPSLALLVLSPCPPRSPPMPVSDLESSVKEPIPHSVWLDPADHFLYSCIHRRST